MAASRIARYRADGASPAVQYLQLRAATGTSLRHSGHSRSVASFLGVTIAVILATGSTTRKYTTAAMMTNATTALMKSP
jgi:hypothetical protein